MEQKGLLGALLVVESASLDYREAADCGTTEVGSSARATNTDLETVRPSWQLHLELLESA